MNLLYRITIHFVPEEIQKDQIQHQNLPITVDEHFTEVDDITALMSCLRYVNYRKKAFEECGPLIPIGVFIRRAEYQQITNSGYIPSFIKPFYYEWYGKGISS